MTLAATPSQAADVALVTVNSLGDGVDARRDGICQTSTPGECTFRAALQEANASTQHATIAFALTGTAPFTINVMSKLPNLTNPLGMTIDGYTQAGSAPNTDALASNAVIAVELKGRGSVGSSAFDGLGITSPGNVVRGLSVYAFAKAFNLAGDNADNNQILGNFVCTNSAGTYKEGVVSLKSFGILMTSGASGNAIGKPGSDNRNVISGCAQRGVSMSFATTGTSGTIQNKIQNNIIGLNPSGSAALPNLSHGVDVNYTRENLIGGDGFQERNVISGNKNTGLEVSHGRGTHDNQVVGNFIGTDVTGNAAPAYTANGEWGVRLEGPKKCDPCTDAAVAEGIPYGNTVRNNVIVNNQKGGILADKGQHFNVIRDNLIGLTLDGTPAKNEFFGIRLEHGAYSNTVGPGNVIAYNAKGVTIAPNGYAPPGAAQPTYDNQIVGNSFHDSSGLGIDLTPFGQANVGGVGDPLVNGGVQAPVLTGGTPTTVSVATCAGCTVQVYLADTVKTTVYGDGLTLLASGTADSSGAVTVTLPQAEPGAVVTALTTRPEAAGLHGGSSEFGKNILLPSA